MTFFERVRHRLRSLQAGLRQARRSLRLGLTMPPIAGADDGGGGSGEGGGGEGKGSGEAGGSGSGDGSGSGEGAGEGEGEKPPWGSDEEFDAKRAWQLIQDVREDSKKTKAERDELRGKVKKHEDASKSDQEKLEERTTTAEKNAAEAIKEAARLRVALRKGLTETQAKRLVGDDEEALEKDADELLESFRSENGDGDGKPRRPKERLRPGAQPSTEVDETDPAKLAGQVPRW